MKTLLNIKLHLSKKNIFLLILLGAILGCILNQLILLVSSNYQLYTAYIDSDAPGTNLKMFLFLFVIFCFCLIEHYFFVLSVNLSLNIFTQDECIISSASASQPLMSCISLASTTLRPFFCISFLKRFILA